MGVTTTQTNKPFNPRGNDQSPLAYNRAKLFSGKALDFDGVNDYVAKRTLIPTIDVVCFLAIFDHNGNRALFIGKRIWTEYDMVYSF